MAKMEVANVMVALGGDMFNTVQKTRVTAAEIAVLQMLHGKDAIHDVQPLGRIEREQRVELARVKHIYGAARNGKGDSVVESLYPGGAARVFERLNELDLDDSQFMSARNGVGGSARQAEETAAREKALAITDDMIEPLVDEVIERGAVEEQPGEEPDELEADDAPMPEGAAEDKANAFS